jgi:hypothetical protein
MTANCQPLTSLLHPDFYPTIFLASVRSINGTYWNRLAESVVLFDWHPLFLKRFRNRLGSRL